MLVIVATFQRIWLILSKTQVDFQFTTPSLAPLEREFGVAFLGNH